jgi:hypothetical protein
MEWHLTSIARIDILTIRHGTYVILKLIGMIK